MSYISLTGLLHFSSKASKIYISQKRNLHEFYISANNMHVYISLFHILSELVPVVKDVNFDGPFLPILYLTIRLLAK